MVAYIKGSLEDVTSNSIVVESQGIGYEILTYDYVIRKLPSLKSEVKIVTYLDVKEDSMRLFGFLSSREKDLFKQLISVSGVGPKGALSILNELGPDNLVAAVIANDSKAISKANGIGAKTAQKVVLELKDKIGKESESEGFSVPVSPVSAGESSAVGDAVAALTVLGYSSSDVAAILKKLDVENMSTEQIIKAVLKQMVK